MFYSMIGAGDKDYVVAVGRVVVSKAGQSNSSFLPHRLHRNTRQKTSMPCQLLVSSQPYLDYFSGRTVELRRRTLARSVQPTTTDSCVPDRNSSRPTLPEHRKSSSGASCNTTQRPPIDMRTQFLMVPGFHLPVG